MTTLTVPQSNPARPAVSGEGGQPPAEYLLMAAAEQKMAGKESIGKKPESVPRQERRRRELIA